jgi:hypothetical protein
MGGLGEPPKSIGTARTFPELTTGRLAALMTLWIICVASIRSRPSRHVAYASNSDRIHARNKPSRCANRVLTRRSKRCLYSTTSTLACKLNGTVRPSDFGVLRLMTRSKFAG